MYLELSLAAAVVIIIILIVTRPDTSAAPATKTVPTLISSKGTKINTVVSATIPPLPQDMKNNSVIRDAGTFSLYYVQNGMLSYIPQWSSVVAMGFKDADIKNYPSARINGMMLGPPILS